MTFTLTFSHILDGNRQPLFIEGIEASLVVSADSRTGAIHHPDTIEFCETHNASVRGVSP